MQVVAATLAGARIFWDCRGRKDPLPAPVGDGGWGPGLKRGAWGVKRGAWGDLRSGVRRGRETRAERYRRPARIGIREIPKKGPCLFVSAYRSAHGSYSYFISAPLIVFTPVRSTTTIW